MPVPTRPGKRADSSQPSSQPRQAKAARSCGGDPLQSQVQVRGAVDPQYKRLRGAFFPCAILALPHVLSSINALAMTPLEAAEAAIKASDFQWLRSLLERSDCDAAEVFRYAASSGRVGAVREMLPNVMGTGESTLDADVIEDLRDAAVAAASYGHLEVVRVLLPEIVQEREFGNVRYMFREEIIEHKNRCVWSILDAAAVNGYTDIVKFAARHAHDDNDYGSPPGSETSSALSGAIFYGHKDVVAYLVSRGYRWNVLEAVDKAAKAGRFEMVNVIYNAYHPEAPDDDIFLRMAHTGLIDALKYLYRAGHDHPELVGKAFVCALGNTRIADFLWETGKVSSEQFEKAFESAARCGSVSSMMSLLNKRSVSVNTLNKVFEDSTHNTVAVLKFLLQTDKIRAESIGTSFRIACRNGASEGRCADVVKFLIKQTCLSSGVINEALLSAVNDNQSRLVGILADDHRLASGVAVKAFESALTKGSKDIIEVLVKKDWVSPELLQSAFMRAFNSQRNSHLREFLYDEGDIPEAVVHNALLNAARRGWTDAVEFLLDKPEVSRDVKIDAFVLAAKNNRVNAIKYMEWRENLPLKALIEALNVATRQKLQQFLTGRIRSRTRRESLASVHGQ